ncbi:hypothetical protein PBCVOR070422_919L [Paramecium bursaria Chlorella virus OR0704.2.2]|nr:hypothetical protein PBCVOR070422_919L [Paramecium bursaria Chlorella virus OR0704.2.2]
MFQLGFIGHERFYEETIAGIPEDDVKKHIRIVCVNEKLPKFIPESFPKECIHNEWEIPEYEKFYQENNYYQNSVFFNTMNIIETLGLDQIGFFQYDMKMSPEIFDHIKRSCTEDKDASIAFYPYPIEQLFEIVKPGAWQFIIQQYSNFFQVPVDPILLESKKLALFHTFVIPKKNYCRMMHFTKKVLPNILTFLTETGTRHIAGTLERLFALILNLEIVTGNMADFIWIDGLIHDDVNLRLRDEFRGVSLHK